MGTDALRCANRIPASLFVAIHGREGSAACTRQPDNDHEDVVDEIREVVDEVQGIARVRIGIRRPPP